MKSVLIYLSGGLVHLFIGIMLAHFLNVPTGDYALYVAGGLYFMASWKRWFAE